MEHPWLHPRLPPPPPLKGLWQPRLHLLPYPYVAERGGVDRVPRCEVLRPAVPLAAALSPRLVARVFVVGAVGGGGGAGAERRMEFRRQPAPFGRHRPPFRGLWHDGRRDPSAPFLPYAVCLCCRQCGRRERRKLRKLRKAPVPEDHDGGGSGDGHCPRPALGGAYRSHLHCCRHRLHDCQHAPHRPPPRQRYHRW